MIFGIKKLLLIASITVVSVFVSVELMIETGALQKISKNLIQEELSKVFRREIHIQSISGDFLSNIILEGVSIASFTDLESGRLMKLDRVDIQLDALNALRHQDILAGIQSIVIQNGFVYIHRTQEDKWNIIDFLLPPPLPKGVTPPPPIALRGTLEFKGLSGVFVDEKGWGSQLPEKPYVFDISTLNVHMDFQDISKVPIRINMVLQGSPATALGTVSVLNGQYQFSYQVQKQRVTDWGPYVLAIPGYRLSGDYFDHHGTLKSKNPFPPAGQIPFIFESILDIHHMGMKLPFMKASIQDIQGGISYGNQSGSLALKTERIQGTVYGYPVRVTGGIDIANRQIQMSLFLDSGNASVMKHEFPGLQYWDFTGKSRAQASLKGQLAAPVFQGQVWASELGFKMGVIRDLRGEFRYFKRQLDLELLEGTYLDSPVLATMAIQFRKQKAPIIQAKVTAKQFDLTPYLNGLDQNQLLVDLRSEFSYEQPHMSGQLRLDQFSNPLWQQKIDSLETDFERVATKSFSLAHAKLNLVTGNPVLFSATMNQQEWQFQANGNNLSIADPFPFDTQKHATVDFELSAKGAIQDARMEPKQIDLRLKAQKGQLFGHLFDRFKLDFHVEDQCIADTQLDFQGTQSILNFKGSGCQERGISFSLKADKIDIGKIAPYMGARMPTTLDGLMDAQLSLKTLPGVALGKDLNLEGDIHIFDGGIWGQRFEEFFIKGVYGPERTVVNELSVSAKRSRISGRGDISPKLDFSIDKDSYIHFGDIPILSEHRIQLRGNGNLSARFQGTLQDPQMAAKMDFDFLSIDQLVFQKMKLRLSYEAGVLSWNPLSINFRDNIFESKGKLYTDDYRQFWHQPIEFDLRFSQVDLYDLSQLSSQVWDLYSAEKKPKIWSILKPGTDFDKIVQSHHFFDKKTEGGLIFDAHSRELLKRFEQYVDQSKAKQKKSGTWNKNMEGQASGIFSVYMEHGKRARVNGQVMAENIAINQLAAKQWFVSVNTNENQEYDIVSGLTLPDDSPSGVKRVELLLGYDHSGFLSVNGSKIETKVDTYMGVLEAKIPLSDYQESMGPLRRMTIKLSLDGSAISALSLVLPNLAYIKNKGQFHLNLSGDFQNMSLNGSRLLLNSAVLGLKLSGDRTVDVQLDNADLNLENDRLNLSTIGARWKVQDLSQAGVQNTIQLSGSLKLPPVNLSHSQGVWPIQTDLVVQDTQLILGATKEQGRLDLNNIRLKGDLFVPIRHNAQLDLFTSHQNLATLSGAFHFSKSKIPASALIQKRSKRWLLGLDMKGSIGDDVSIEGAILNSGAWSLASTVYVELAPSKKPLRLKGNTFEPDIHGSVVISGGQLALVDQTYTFISTDQQQLFFQDRLELVKENQVLFTGSSQKGTQLSYLPAITIRAVSYFENISTSNINNNLPHKAIILRMDGPLNDIGDNLFFDEFDVDRVYASRPNTNYVSSRQILSREESGFQNQFSNRNQSDFRASSQADSGSLARIGESKANFWFKSTLRPFERKMADALGIYDIRINYDLGRTLTDSVGAQSAASSRDHLLGMHFIWQLVPNTIFFRTKLDTTLSPDKQYGVQGIQVTEEEFSYYISKKLTFNMSNIQEYGNDYRFNPKASLKYSQGF